MSTTTCSSSSTCTSDTPTTCIGCGRAEMVSTSLAKVLAARRHAFNERVMEARHAMPGFDTTAFGVFVTHEIDAICVAVDAVDACASERVVEAAFDIGLGLVAQGLAGPAA